MLAAVIFVLAGRTALAQEGSSHDVLLAGNTFVPGTATSDIAYAFGLLRTHEFIDSENPDLTNPTFKMVPREESVLNGLTIAPGGSITFFQDGTNCGKLQGLNATQWIDLNEDTNPALPSAYVHSLQTIDRIEMGAISAGDATGKTVFDVAEAINAIDAEAADVVIISPVEDLTVTRSVQAFDPAIAGVISTNPRLNLGQAADRKPLALAGVAPCKVSAENGAIQPGDMLVSASMPGHAMRADADDVQPGMLVGSALEPHEEGAGIINILVNQ